jgi:hypothetical protein
VDGRNSKMTATKAGVLPWSPLQFSVGYKEVCIDVFKAASSIAVSPAGGKLPGRVGLRLAPRFCLTSPFRLRSGTAFVFVHCRSDS